MKKLYLYKKTKMKIVKAEIIVLNIPMTKSLEVSFWSIKDLKPIVVKLTDELWNIGYWESILLPFPMTHFEYFDTWLTTLEKFIIPSILNKDIDLYEEHYFKTIESFILLYSGIKNFEMTKTWVENAFVHILTQRLNKNIYKMFETVNFEIETEACFGIPADLNKYLLEIENELIKWFKEIKLKISKWNDIELIKNVRNKFPKLKISLDANQDYNLDEFKKIVKIIDENNIEQVEQPFKYDDYISNIEIKKIMKTKLCLDESISRIDQLENMVYNKWIDILNIKIWRVGWVYSAYKINKFCEKNNIWTWVGWLLETDLWRSFNLAIAWMSNIKYNNDISVWDEFYSDYIVKRPYKIKKWAIKIDLNSKWIWFEIDDKKIKKYTVCKITLK